MRQRLLEKELAPALAKVKENLLEDRTVDEFVGDREILRRFIRGQEELLRRHFDRFGDAAFAADPEMIRFYEESEVPYPIVYKNLNLLKTELMKRLMGESGETRFLFEIEAHVDLFCNAVAKIYIRKEARRLECVENSIFRDKLLYRAHLPWLKQIERAILEEDLSRFPLVSFKSCDFQTYLHYPEALMVCMEEGLCNFLGDLHRLIHSNAHTFYLLCVKEDFVQAYIAFKDFLLQVINFSKTISELYFVTQANLEERFFKLVETLAWSRRRMHLSIIDARGLRALNHRFGEETVNRLLQQAEARVRAIIDGDEARVLLVRGATATFYMLTIGCDDEEMATFVGRIYEALTQEFVFEGKGVEVAFSIATLEMDGFYEKSRDDLTKLLLHLKERAHTMAGAYLVNGTEEKSRLQRWLVEAYSDIHFVKEKIRRNEIDLLFQPIYETQSGEMAMLEVLVRLVEGKKLLPASLFIDTVFDLDLIDVLDGAVLEALMEKESIIGQVVPLIFVNVSYKSLMRPAYQRKLEAFVARFGPERFVFELTEQQIVENIALVEELHARHGIRFAVDDFGSGYSSLKTVAELARHGVLWAVKIDGSLIETIEKDEHTRQMVRLIVQMCRVISVASVAEFVESADELAALKEVEVTYVQGFHLSRPKRIEELLVEKLETSGD